MKTLKVFLVLRPLLTIVMVTRERIVENTTELFQQKGCKSITMDDISAHNGISKRTLYELFADKSSLLEACLIDAAKKKKMEADLLKRRSANILEYILMFQDMESRLQERTSHVLLEEMRKFYPEVYKRTITIVKQEQLNYTQSLLEEGIREGMFEANVGSVEIQTKILSLLVGLNSFGINECFHVKEDRHDIFMSSVVVYLRGLSTDKGRKVIEDYFRNKLD